MRTKKVKAAGRLRAGYGKSVRGKITAMELKQRIKQVCPYCGKHAKRTSKGIWKCTRCMKKFASHAYYLENKNK